MNSETNTKVVTLEVTVARLSEDVKESKQDIKEMSKEFNRMNLEFKELLMDLPNRFKEEVFKIADDKYASKDTEIKLNQVIQKQIKEESLNKETSNILIKYKQELKIAVVVGVISWGPKGIALLIESIKHVL